MAPFRIKEHPHIWTPVAEAGGSGGGGGGVSRRGKMRTKEMSGTTRTM